MKYIHLIMQPSPLSFCRHVLSSVHATPKSGSFTAAFPSKGYAGLVLTRGSLLHIEVVFVSGLRSESSSSCTGVWPSGRCSVCVEKSPFRVQWSWHSRWKSVDHKVYEFVSGFSVLLH